MKLIVKTALLILMTGALLTGKAYSAVLTNKYLSECVKRDVTEQISSLVDGKISVEIGEIPYKSIDVPNGNIKVKSSVNLKFFTSRTVAKIVVNVNGSDLKTFGVPVKIRVYNDVWIAREFINRGDSLSVTNIFLENREVSDIAQNAVTSKQQPFGSLVRRTFAPGEVIDTRFVESAPLVSKNSQVSVMFKTSMITVTISCESLDNGKVGDLVRVRNKQYKKDYTGRVLDSGMVLVNI